MAFTCWLDPLPHGILVMKENENEWTGYPAANPLCPALTYPKFAWEEVSP